MKKIKKSYTIKGRYARAKENYTTNFWKLNTFDLIKQTIKCFQDTPRCLCHTNISCSVHIKC